MRFECSCMQAVSSKARLLQQLRRCTFPQLGSHGAPSSRRTIFLVPPPMATLAACLGDLTSSSGRLRAAQALMDEVYGPFDPKTDKTARWQPRAYTENKSRYLWTDAFGVCNYITLAVETKEQRYLEMADRLIQAVHDTLGRDREGRRLGSASEEHPTLGGLRIGKKFPEGHPDGDGQYFHYITKWAFALNRMSLATGQPKYQRWAVELMQAVHRHFVRRPTPGSGLTPGMFWKISVDMQRPTVLSEGNLDPADGLITVRLLRAAAEDPSTLVQEEADFHAIVESKWRRYSSNDPLDLGEALWLAHWALPDQERWAKVMSERSALALEELWRDGYFHLPAAYRLAFREFGTTLGTQLNPAAQPEWGERVDGLHRFWAPRCQERDSDITPVMFAASLVPGVWGRTYEGRLRAAF